MFDKEAARKRMKDLEAEVKAVMADTELTAAEKHERMDKIEAEDTDLSTQLKNHARALSFRAGNELEDQTGAPPDEGLPKDALLKKNLDTYELARKDAAERSRGAYSFEFNTRVIPHNVELKTQGIANMMGENAYGTTAGVATSQGTYFLPGTAGAAIPPQFIPGIVELRFYENVISSLWPSFPCTSPIVTYVREATWTNAAAATGEALTKPTSSNTVTRYTEQVGKIAALVRVTDEMIQDAPLFWALTQRRGAEGIARQEEVELLAGSGYPGVHGLLSHAASFTQGAAGSAYNITIGGATGAADTSETVASVVPGRVITVTGTTVPDQGDMSSGAQLAEGLLTAMTDIRYSTFFEPDAIILNPLDFMVIRLAKDGVGQYLGGSFFGTNYGNGQNTPIGETAVDTGLSLWNKKVVTTPAIPAGTAIVGDFGDSGQILRLGGLRSDITNMNGTDFEQNMWTARYEERVGLMVERPELYQVVKLVNTGS